jgi:SAM-dependent methyltransferase
MGPDLRYAGWREFEGVFHQTVRELIEAKGAARVCDIGGGAKPTLSPEEVAELNVDYTVLDISDTELAKASSAYRRVQGDITGELPDIGPFDLVLSHMLAEHVADPEAMHRNVIRLLTPGGVAVHLFPTLYDPDFVLNAIAPAAITSKLLQWVQPHRTPEGDSAKFPAYYRWCRGSTKRQVARLTGVGFEVETYHSFFWSG